MRDLIFDVLSKTPSLLGREIAKKLGMEKREVNSFLNKNRDEFHQDENYRWNNFQKETEITFPSGWVNALQYESVLAEHPNLFELNVSIRFIFETNTKFLLETIARFLALTNQLAQRGIRITIDLTSCADSIGYLNRVGFFDLLLNNIRILPVKPVSSLAVEYKGNNLSLVEFGSISPNSKNKPLILSLHSSFVNKTSNDYDLVALTVFSEFIGNVSEHSESNLDGFAALQIYNPFHKRRHIQTVISDSGLGVVKTLRETLEKNYPELYSKFPDDGEHSDIGLAFEVFSKGGITRHGKPSDRGLGFKSSREQAAKFDANLSIRLDTFNIQLIYRDGLLSDYNISKGLTLMQGTHICFDFLLTDSD
ncbi:MAG: ATP-binding protein [Acinetobacter venetianus]|uniref:ATP-binding protein n=1 Tax=Acinetobacter venetianus TaxID=52133 RepID=UPI003C78E140